MSSPAIAAIASPPGMGAVALVRLSGAGAAEVAGAVFRGRPVSGWIPRQQHFGRIVDAAGSVVDEVLLTWFPGPGSFTGEDMVEISCHGGPLVTRRVLESLLEAGAEPAHAGEFSERAFCNGRLDLTQAEAIMDLISAKTDLALKAAGEQLAGRLGREVEGLRQGLIGLLAHVEAYIDFPEEDISPETGASLLAAMEVELGRMRRLLATADQGRILREGLRTVICGPPNAGKSSLLNRLVGFDRAIVSEMAGTTRDTVEEFVSVAGIPLRLIDTAGIREGAGEIEREGIERSRAAIAGAELVLLVVDASRGASQLDPIKLPEGSRLVRLLNKADLPRHPDWEAAEGIPLSCLDEASVDAFRGRLASLLLEGEGFDADHPVAINARHQGCLRRAARDLDSARVLLEAGESPEFVAVELRSSLEAVGGIVGRTDVEEILSEIFSTFCIGK
jgi:tRNA modification GTPase